MNKFGKVKGTIIFIIMIMLIINIYLFIIYINSRNDISALKKEISINAIQDQNKRYKINDLEKTNLEQNRLLQEYTRDDTVKLSGQKNLDKLESMDLKCKRHIINDEVIEFYTANNIYSVYVSYFKDSKYNVSDATIRIYNDNCDLIKVIDHSNFQDKYFADALVDINLYSNKLLIEYHISPDAGYLRDITIEPFDDQIYHHLCSKEEPIQCKFELK